MHQELPLIATGAHKRRKLHAAPPLEAQEEQDTRSHHFDDKQDQNNQEHVLVRHLGNPSEILIVENLVDAVCFCKQAPTMVGVGGEIHIFQ